MHENKTEKYYKIGLSADEVIKLHAAGQGNVAPEQITKSMADILKDNIFTLFNLYNFIIAFLLILVGAYSNLLFIFIIILNVSIGIFQEIQAKKLVEELTLVSAPRVFVIREGNELEILTTELVLGDVIQLRIGDQIPVDAEVLHGVIEVNESLLTGEADNVMKVAESVLLSGSFVVSGKCYAEVTAVGANSYANSIAHQAKQHKQVNSEFKSSMRKVTNFTSFLIIPLGIILFVEAYFLRSAGMKVSVITTAAALLGMLPKGLLLFVSLALASGVIKLSKSKVLVQEMHVLETLAHVDVLCLDKTGTITEGKMQVTDVDILDAKMNPLEIMPQMLGAIDDANATFMAMVEHFGKEEIEGTNIVPFSSSRKWSAVTLPSGTYILGAPEKINRGGSHAKVEKAMQEGSRILLLARAQKPLQPNAILDNLLLKPIAMITLKDPIRAHAKETLAFFANEGVQLKIISGDHPITVASIAAQAGLEDAQKYIDMSTITTEEATKALVHDYQVFGRVSPDQKKWLVEGLQMHGHTVAMTGDGVNDVLALKASDCSIAMAEGSEATKQVAQLVLLESDFSVLPETLMEGRRVVNNVTNAGAIFFVKTVYSVLLTLLCIITNVPFPLVPIQITLIDLAIEGYPSFFMSFKENKEKVTGHFLPNVFRRSIPASLTIIIHIVWMAIAGKVFNLDQEAVIASMYYMIAFVTIIIAIKVLMPFDKLTAFLAITMSVGFYVATWLFRSLLHLPDLSKTTLVLFALAAVSTIIILPVMSRVVTNVFTKRNIH